MHVSMLWLLMILDWKHVVWERCVRRVDSEMPRSGAFCMQHLDEQVVAGHVSAQVFGAQVLLGLGAQGTNLRQPQHQLTEPVHMLRVRGECVFQQSAVHLLLHALH